MSETSLVIASVRLCVSRGSAAVSGLTQCLSGDIKVPFSVFIPSRPATLGISQICDHAVKTQPSRSIPIPHHVQILCSEYFHIAIHFHQFHLKLIPN
jgi:hypothetical protein